MYNIWSLIYVQVPWSLGSLGSLTSPVLFDFWPSLKISTLPMPEAKHWIDFGFCDFGFFNHHTLGKNLRKFPCKSRCLRDDIFSITSGITSSLLFDRFNVRIVFIWIHKLMLKNDFFSSWRLGKIREKSKGSRKLRKNFKSKIPGKNERIPNFPKKSNAK